MIVLVVALWGNISQLVESHKIFLLKQFFWKIVFTSLLAVIRLSSIERSFIPNISFEIMRNMNILIMSLFSRRVTCVTFFNCCCWKFSSDFHYLYCTAVVWIFTIIFKYAPVIFRLYTSEFRTKHFI